MSDNPYRAPAETEPEESPQGIGWFAPTNPDDLWEGLRLFVILLGAYLLIGTVLSLVVFGLVEGF